MVFRETKIDKFQVLCILALVEEILELQIAVNDIVGVEVSNCKQHLSASLRCIALAVVPALGEAGVELATGHELHDDMELTVRLVDILQPRDMRMIQLEVDFNLAPELHLRLGSQAPLPEALHCKLAIAPLS